MSVTESWPLHADARETPLAATVAASSCPEFRLGWPACYRALADILQRRERLQQPDADAGDGTGQKSDAGDHHQHAHHALDAVEMPFHPRKQRGELFDHESRQKEGD